MELFNVSAKPFQFLSAQNHDNLIARPDNDDWQLTIARFEHIGRSIVTMECCEFHAQRGSTISPLLFFSEHPMGDLAK